MINVLVNAYACSPHKGSEPGMGWNWVKNLSKYCNLHIITEGEWKDEIEEAVDGLPQGQNMTFYYNPVSDRIRQMCWNQGDWRFYYYYKKWQKEVLSIAQNIESDNPIDIVHQLNMVGFREPGYLWKIKDNPFIWGPIGGMKNFPTAYLSTAPSKSKIKLRLKNIINNLQIKYDRRVYKALHKANILVSAIPETKEAILKNHSLASVLLSETGCYVNEKKKPNKKRFFNNPFKIIWVGKFDFRKQLGLALRTIAKIKNLDGLEFHVVGTGNAKQVTHYKRLADDLNISELVVWHGKVPHSEVMELMQNSQLFFFTSVSDETSTVVLEALGSNLPILCFNASGYGPIVNGNGFKNKNVGETIEFTTPSRSVDEFADKIEFFYNNREILSNFSNYCFQRQKELSWENNAKKMITLYERAIKDHKES